MIPYYQAPGVVGPTSLGAELTQVCVSPYPLS